MKHTYTQCLLRHDNAYHIAWIPSQFAHVDKLVHIKSNGIVYAQWVVDTVYATSTSELVESHESDYRLMSTFGF